MTPKILPCRGFLSCFYCGDDISELIKIPIPPALAAFLDDSNELYCRKCVKQIILRRSWRDQK